MIEEPSVIDVSDLQVRRAAAGLGLFTKVDIPRDTRVAEYVGKKLTWAEYQNSNSVYLFEVSTRKTIDGSPRWNLARYINHSCRPNCEVEITRGRVFIVSRRRIKAGEELNYDYGEEYFNDIIKPKGCRCEKCASPASVGRKKKAA